MKGKLIEPCLCGADDCEKCHPEILSEKPAYCLKHRRYYDRNDVCPSCEDDYDDEKLNRRR